MEDGSPKHNPDVILGECLYQTALSGIQSFLSLDNEHYEVDGPITDMALRLLFASQNEDKPVLEVAQEWGWDTNDVESDAICRAVIDFKQSFSNL